jgi:signal transduction histidine kinase
MGVMGNISIAMMSSDRTDERNEHLAESIKLIEEAKRLTSQLLTFARGGAPKRKSVLLQEHMPKWVRFAASGSSADIKIDIKNNIPPVSIDTDQFSQVINNLVINALQSGGKDVRIIIEARYDEPVQKTAEYNSITITVKDNGPGIPEDIIDRVFDPYYSSKAGGTGLGLTICHSIVTQHGERYISKINPRSGASFIIKLPAKMKNRSISQLMLNTALYAVQGIF